MPPKKKCSDYIYYIRHDSVLNRSGSCHFVTGPDGKPCHNPILKINNVSRCRDSAFSKSDEWRLVDRQNKAAAKLQAAAKQAPAKQAAAKQAQIKRKCRNDSDLQLNPLRYPVFYLENGNCLTKEDIKGLRPRRGRLFNPYTNELLSDAEERRLQYWMLPKTPPGFYIFNGALHTRDAIRKTIFSYLEQYGYDSNTAGRVKFHDSDPRTLEVINEARLDWMIGNNIGDP